MKKINKHFRLLAGRATSLLLMVLILASTGCDRLFDELEDHFNKKKQEQHLQGFYQVNLVGSDQEYGPSRIDANLVNAWGLAFNPTGVAWINAAGTGQSQAAGALLFC